MGSEQGTPDFEALARQYWTAWGDLVRGGSGSAGGEAIESGLRAWQQAVAEWTRMAHGARSQADASVGRYTAQAHDWYARMQQVAAQFAGSTEADPAQVAQAWRQALGASGENPFPELFRSLRGQGHEGLSQWIEDATPFLEAARREGSAWLGMPAFGFAREHQERWQRLAQAQLDYQQRLGAYNGLTSRAGQEAFERFERKLAERAQAGRPPDSARALFDLWIDAAEEAYADIALTPEFREVHGALVDAQMRLRAGIQREVEQAAAQFGMPTRTEVDAAHRKIAELQREVRRLRDAVAAAGDAGSASAGRRPAVKKAAKPAPAPAPPQRPAAAGRRAPARPHAKRTPAKRAPTKRAPTKRAGSKPAAARSASRPAAKSGRGTRTGSRTAARKPAGKR